MADTKAKLLKQKEEIEQKLKELEEKEKKGFVIKSWKDGSEVYVSKADNLRDAVLEAVKEEADLWRANLWGADLRRADLREANLRGAELGYAQFFGKGGSGKLKKDQVEHFLRALGFEVED